LRIIIVMLLLPIIFSSCDKEIDCSTTDEKIRIERGNKLIDVTFDNKKEEAIILIKNCANLEASDELGYFPLYGAASSGWPDVVRLLIGKGVKVDQRNLKHQHFKGWTSLMATSYNRSYETTKTLLELGADPNIKSYDGDTFLLLMMVYDRPVEKPWRLLRLLKQYKTDFNVKNKKGENAIVKYLKDTMYYKNKFGFIPATKHVYEILECLVAYGVNVEVKDRSGHNAIYYAKKIGDKKIIDTISKGIN
jgi:ankyrin repeat protein